MKHITLIALSTILISCSSQTDNNNSTLSNKDSLNINSESTTESNLDKQNLNVTDTIFSNNRIIISILPSDKYLDSMQKDVPEDEWNEVVSDNEYYRDVTEQYLIKKGYKIVERPQNRFWYFKLTNGQIQIIDILNLHDKWGNLIFNGKDSAFIFESTSPEIELNDKI